MTRQKGKIRISESSNYKIINESEFPKFNKKKRKFINQSDEWKNRFIAITNDLKNMEIDSIYLLHGTFVGMDPTGLSNLFSLIFQENGKKIERKIHLLIKSSSDLLIKDQGNFTKDYGNLFTDATKGQISTNLLKWSSENNHFARLTGLLHTISQLYNDASEFPKKKSFLILTHSHGGQILAMLNHLLEQTETGSKICNFIMSHKLTDEFFPTKLEKLRSIQFRFVTLGTPNYYSWPKNINHKILHLVNHRGDVLIGARKSGALFSKYGDYVQMFGISGSDFPAHSQKHRDYNKELDQILGKGCHPKAWRKNLKSVSKVSPYGYTYLVDYGDQGKMLPNCVQTVFGHGVYTEYRSIILNFSLIIDYFK